MRPRGEACRAFFYCFVCRLGRHLLRLIKLTFAAAIALALIPHAVRYYAFPRDRLIQIAKQCENDADKLTASDAAKWTEAHNGGTNNPYRAQRDARVDICIKADGWCSMSDDRPAFSNPAMFAPRDPVARALYRWRYADESGSICRD